MTQALKETSVQATESLRGVEEDPEANENMRKGHLPRVSGRTSLGYVLKMCPQDNDLL